MPLSNLEFIKHLCRLCYVIYHCLRRGTHQLIVPALLAPRGGLISRQLASFRPLSLRLILYPARFLADAVLSRSALQLCFSSACGVQVLGESRVKTAF